MRQKAETEIDTAHRILEAAEQDFAELERWWPLSKRGSNAQRAFGTLRERIRTARQCAADAAVAIAGADASPDALRSALDQRRDNCEARWPELMHGSQARAYVKGRASGFAEAVMLVDVARSGEPLPQIQREAPES